MPFELQDYQRLFFELLDSIPFDVADDDYSVLDKHIPHLEELDRLGKSAVSVFDLYKKTHLYTSPSYRNRLGLSEGFNNGHDGLKKQWLFARSQVPDQIHQMKKCLKTMRKEYIVLWASKKEMYSYFCFISELTNSTIII